LKKIRYFVAIGALLFLFGLFPKYVLAQEFQIPDTTVQYSWVNPVVKSIFLPGWGQINQERLTESAFFYFSTATYYYRTLFHYYHYQETKTESHKNLFKINLYVSLFLHGLNVLDVAETAINKQPPGWQGGLFDDKPLKSPWGAVLRSAMIPGWGQVYNESYWKAAGYFLVDGYLIYKISEADAAYRSSGDIGDRNHRSDYSWYFGLAYLITMADAYAGAYLYKFDQAMELTVTPVFDSDKLALGIYVCF